MSDATESVACLGGRVRVGDKVTLDQGQKVQGASPRGLRIPVVGSAGFLNTGAMQDREATVLWIGSGSEPCLLLAPGDKVIEAFPRQFSIARLRLKAAQRLQVQLEQLQRQPQLGHWEVLLSATARQ